MGLHSRQSSWTNGAGLAQFCGHETNVVLSRRGMQRCKQTLINSVIAWATHHCVSIIYTDSYAARCTAHKHILYTRSHAGSLLCIAAKLWLWFNRLCIDGTSLMVLGRSCRRLWRSSTLNLHRRNSLFIQAQCRNFIIVCRHMFRIPRSRVHKGHRVKVKDTRARSKSVCPVRGWSAFDWKTIVFF